MFDLERAVREWRRSVAEALGGPAEVVDELEGHLREEHRRLVLSGREPGPAWEEAVARLGGPGQLAEEFAKLPPPSWLPARLALLAEALVAAVTAWLLASRLLHGRAGAVLACHVFAVAVGYAGAFAVGGLAVWSVLSRAFGGWDVRRARALVAAARKLAAFGLVLTAAGVALGCWWARDNLGRAWGWDLKELGGLSVLAWYAVTLWCLLRRPAADLAVMVMGVAGNVVVCLSWFGPALVADGHSYGAPPALGPLLVGFLLAQLLALGVALVPPCRFDRVSRSA